jgi:predicted component of type VI protein secretion system
MLTLILKDGDHTQTLKLGQDEITIGRSKENTVVISNRKVSRKHAKIERIGATYQLTDLDSGNGTKLNGQKIDFQALKTGDEFKIGDALLTVQSMDDSADRVEVDGPVSEEEGLLTDDTPVSQGATEKVEIGGDELSLKDDDIRIESVEEDLLEEKPAAKPAPKAPPKPAPKPAPKDEIIKLPLGEDEDLLTAKTPAAGTPKAQPAKPSGPAKPAIRFRPKK